MFHKTQNPRAAPRTRASLADRGEPWYPRPMPDRDEYLAFDDARLLADCDVHLHRSSGPGGQHRNKVCSAVRLRHRPTEVSASASDSRRQQDNRRLALRRLRMRLCCRLRRPVDLDRMAVPKPVRECIYTPRGPGPAAPRRIRLGRRDPRFWRVAAFLLDLLDATDGRLAPAAGRLGVSTSSFAALLRSERHVLEAAQGIRRRHGLGGLT